MGVIRNIMYLSGNLLQVKHLALYGIWRWYTILNNYIIMIQRHNNYQRAVIPNFAICTYPLAICISLFSLGLSIQIVYILNMKWSVILVIYICNFSLCSLKLRYYTSCCNTQLQALLLGTEYLHDLHVTVCQATV